jgi:hypothetical protein
MCSCSCGGMGYVLSVTWLLPSSRLRPSGQLRVLVFGMTCFSVWIGPSQSRHHPTYRYRSHRESVDGMFTQSVRSKQRYRPIPRRVPKSSLSVVKMVSRTAGYPVTTYLLQRATRTQYVCCQRRATALVGSCLMVGEYKTKVIHRVCVTTVFQSGRRFWTIYR